MAVLTLTGHAPCTVVYIVIVKLKDGSPNPDWSCCLHSSVYCYSEAEGWQS